MSKPQRRKQDKPVTDADWERMDKSFMNSEMGIGLAANGIELNPRRIGSNIQKYDDTTARQRKTSFDVNYTIIGKELYEPKDGDVPNGKAHSALRDLDKMTDKYMKYISSQESWHFWQTKMAEERETSRAAVEVEGQVETLAWFHRQTTRFKDIKPGAFQHLTENIDNVLEYIAGHFTSYNPVNLDDYEGWKSKMNWNRNSGHPYYFAIPEERFSSQDWPNFRNWLMSLVRAMNREQLEELYASSPEGATLKNVNEKIYALFFRPSDRVIHGVRLLLKPLGANFTANSTQQLRGSAIAWDPLDNLRDEFSVALGDAIGVSADDLKKFDRSLHSLWFHLLYERYWESKLFEAQPELRMICGVLLYEMTHDVELQLSATRSMDMRPGLWSGHPLTQFVGSIIHLTLYDNWKENFSMEPTLQKVLSDDGIQVYNDHTKEELETLQNEHCGPMLKELGMLLHPEKSMASDPTNEIYMGQLLGEELYDHDMPFFLKQKFLRQRNASHGNPLGVTRSILQVERKPSDTAIGAEVKRHLIGTDNLLLGGAAEPTARIIDLARIVDLLASSSLANPLIEDQLRFVQKAWPGFEKGGVDILENKLSMEWRDGTTSHAGGTLDSGISRKSVVEGLLGDPDVDKFWDDLAFRV